MNILLNAHTRDLSDAEKRNHNFKGLFGKSMLVMIEGGLKLVMLVLIPVTLQNVIIAQGRVRGVAHDGYVSYTGIPYATVAGNMERFKKAGLAPFWNSIREPHESHCSSVSPVDECLQLDVHAPSSSSATWPVLVWVTGSSGRYNPRLLVQEGLIVVVVHHRLGPHGFLCLDKETIPGNAGIKDVVLALRWVQDNIVAFKGNPARVVIAGQSFGAAMVEALMLSSMASGLYHGAILQSGTVLSPWAFNYDAMERAMTLEGMLSNKDDMPKIILNAKTEELLAKSNKLDMPYIPFGICIEKPTKNEERLLYDAPFDLLSNKKIYSVPLIMGYNSDEAYIFASTLKDSKIMKKITIDTSILVPEELKFSSDREMNQVWRNIEDMYFKDNRTLAAILEYHRDGYFVSHIHRSVKLHASATHFPVYFYQFSHIGDIGVQPEPGVKRTGAAHSDELAYFWGGAELSGEDGIVQKSLVKLWTNFVKYLSPTHAESTSWDPVSPDSLRLLDISTELKMMDFPHPAASHMWDDIYDKYYYTKNRVTEPYH